MKTKARIEIEVEIEFEPRKGELASGGMDELDLMDVCAISSKMPFVPPISIVDILDYDEGQTLKGICWQCVDKTIT